MFSHFYYLSSFFFPTCVAWFLYTGPHDAVTALAWTIPLWSLIVADWLAPKVDPEKTKPIIADYYYDAILYALAFMQFLIISLLLIYASQLPWGSISEIATSIVNLVVLRILVGTTSGSSAIIVAHELIHRPKQHMRLLGKLLLYTVCYEHFSLCHLKGHHANVATPEDITTARLNESFKVYWKRVITGHFKYAWASESKRLNSMQPYSKLLANLVLRGVTINFVVVILILAIFGWTAAFIFLYQALSGVRLLETINYYQHWGLEHGKEGNTLGWVNQSCVTEYALVGLSNHVGHHQNVALPFHKLPYSEQGPKMPYGYFVTNLWVKLNNDSYQSVSKNILESYFSQK